MLGILDIHQPLLKMKGKVILHFYQVYVSLIRLICPEMTGTTLCRWTIVFLHILFSGGCICGVSLELLCCCLYLLFLYFYLKSRSCQSFSFHLMSPDGTMCNDCDFCLWVFRVLLKNSPLDFLLMIKLCFTSQIVHSAKTICSLATKLFSLGLKNESANLFHQR